MNRVDNTKQLFFKSIVKSWWVGVFFIFCFILYDQSIKASNRQLLDFQCRYKAISLKKDRLLQENQDLNARISSCRDPAWIEQLLIRELGVVPKGYMKVYFKKEG